MLMPIWTSQLPGNKVCDWLVGEREPPVRDKDLENVWEILSRCVLLFVSCFAG